MRLTDEEMKKLKRHVSKIDDYIRYEIIPKLGGTSIGVEFGEVVRDSSRWIGGRKYYLCVSEGGARGCGGNNKLTMLPTNATPEALRNSFCHPDAGLTLLREWPTVKGTLLEHIREVDAMRAALDDFTV